jgi:hypothetical protein
MEKENSGDCNMKMWIEEIATLLLLFGIGYIGVLFLIALMPI